MPCPYGRRSVRRYTPSRHSFHAGHGGGGEVAEEVVRAQRGAEGQPEAEHAGRGGPVAAAGAPAQLRRGEDEDLPHGLVEPADAGKAGGEGDLGHRQLAGLDQQPGGLRALCAGQCERAGAEFGQELALDLSGAVAEPGGQAGDALAVHHAVGDQPHGPGDEVGALVPLRGAGAGVRAAALAGAEPGLLGGEARVERHVLDLGRHHRAARAAVDAGGEHGGEEPAVEAGVLGLDGSHAPVEVRVHAPSIAGAHGWGSRKSDMALEPHSSG